MLNLKFEYFGTFDIFVLLSLEYSAKPDARQQSSDCGLINSNRMRAQLKTGQPLFETYIV